MNRTSTYSEISRLSSQLGTENQIKKRRDAGKKLLDLLSDHNIRVRLAREATPSQSSPSEAIVLQRKALSQLWRVLVRNALLAASKATGGRGKLTVEDVILPYRFLFLCDSPTDDGPYTGGTKLSSREILDLLKYCLNTLADEDAVAVAENDLLTMLHRLCSREDYVVHYRPHAEINNILAELDLRLSNPALEDSASPVVFVSAAKTFCYLLHTCQRLGTGMHLVIPSCMEVVSKYCKHHLPSMATRTSSSQALPFMFGGAVALMKAHPEQTIAPLVRHGRPMLQFAKRCFVHPQWGFNKATFTDYFQAHLLVCQAAGSLQGLLPGDLGDVGPASLNEAEVESLLLLVTSESELKRVFSSSDPAKSSRRNPGATTSQTASTPLNERVQRHLELCARLMACAQRLYIARVEWNACKDPLQMLLDKMTDARKRGDEFFFVKQPSNPFDTDPPPPAPTSDIAESPWINVIAKPLWMATPRTSVQRLKSTGMSDGSSQDVGTELNASEPSLDLPQRFPILQIISESSQEQSSVHKDLIECLLKLVSACAEAFPGGECWSSRSQTNWITLVPEDLLENDIIQCNGCSPEDLALVVYLVSNILEQCGGPDGDSSLQTWALLGLIRLTETTAVLFHRLKDQTSSTNLLSLVWRRVWGIIMRPDFRYSSFTGSASPNSNGEFVLVLLTEMVRNYCTDPSIRWTPRGDRKAGHDATFMHVHQADVWQIPAFGDALSVHSRSVFDLMYAMVCHVGLSDQGEDTIDERPANTTNAISLATEIYGSRSSPNKGRRFRLLHFVLRNLEQTISCTNETKQRILQSACASISVLLGDDGVYSPSTFILERPGRFRFTDISDFALGDYNRPLGIQPRVSRSILEALWDDSRFNETSSHRRQILDSSRFDFVHSNVLSARTTSLLEERRSLSGKAQSESASQHETLYSFALGFIRRLLGSEGDESMGEPSGESSSSSLKEQSYGGLSTRTSTLKVFLVVSIIPGMSKLSEAENMKELSVVIVSVFDDVITRLPSLSPNDDEYTAVITDLYHVLDALTILFVRENAPPITRIIANKTRDIFEMCTSMLLACTESSQVDDHDSPRPSAPSSRGASQNTQGSGFDSDFSNSADNIKKPTMESLNDSDSDYSRTKKRKARSHSGKRARRRVLSDREASSREGSGGHAVEVEKSLTPSGKCARTLAAIAILLQPSSETCQLVAETLLWPCLNDDFRFGGIGTQELDPEQAVFCLELLCREETVLHHHFNNRDDSVVQLCCNAILAMRTSSGPEMLQHLHGFMKCAGLVDIGESNRRGDALSHDECKEIICTLKAEESKQDRRSLRLRPQFRATRLRAANKAFCAGRENYHKEFDLLFATQFVVPALDDISEPVRSRACSAVGAALRVLEDQRRIVDSVLTVLPPLTRSRDKKKILTRFRRWYEDKDLGSKGGLTAVENAVWDDAFISLEATSLLCRAFIAGFTSDAEIFRGSVFEIVKLSATRPDLEDICFHACERIALIRGFRCTEDMIRDESEWLMYSWLETKSDLTSIPLLMSAPSLLRQLLRAGQSHVFRTARIADRGEGSGVVDKPQLIQEAAGEYVKRSAHLLVPLIFLYSGFDREVHEGGEELPSTPSLTKMCQRGWDYLRETCDLLDIASDDDSIRKKLVGSHLPDLIAFFFPATKQSGGAVQSKATKILEQVERQISEVTSYNKQKQKTAHLALRRMLQLSGKHEHAFGTFEFPHESCANAVRSFIREGKQPDTTRNKSGGVIDGMGITVAECFLYAKAWLYESVLDIQKVKSFVAIEVLCDLVTDYYRDYNDANSQLGFAIQVMLDIILEQPTVRDKALMKLKEMLQEAFGLKAAANEMELSSVLFKLLGTLLHAHEASQTSLVSECNLARTHANEKMKRTLGLVLLKDSGYFEADDYDMLSETETDDVVPGEDQFRLELAVREYESDVSRDKICIMISTYEVLELVLEHADSWNASYDDVSTRFWPSLVRRSYRYGFLSDKNEKFYAQTLLRGVIEIDADDSGAVSDKEKKSKIRSKKISTFAERLEKMVPTANMFNSHIRSASRFSTSFGAHDQHSLSIDAALLLAVLNDLVEVLRDSRQSGTLANDMETSDVDTRALVQRFLDLCASNCPDEIRLAASRCIGLLGPSQVEPLSAMEIESPCSCRDNHSEFDIEKPLFSVYARAMERLTEYLTSAKVETSLAAVEAIKSLLSTSGANGWLRLIKSEECIRLLRPFQKQTVHDEAPFSPTKVSVSLISLEEYEKQPSMCWWDDKLWYCWEDSDASYEKWIRRLVCSLISGCYTDKSDFFGRCLKMSAIEHGFAASIFPGIVFDLLDDSEGTDGKNNAREKSADGGKIQPDDNTNIKLLSRGFSILIGTSGNKTEKQPHPRAVDLAVYTLDRLRIRSQHIFQLSKHQKNPRTLTNRSYPSQTKSSSRRSSSKSPPPKSLAYNKDNIEPSPTWRGVPYGFILDLDGLQVARACIRAKRYASALFYAEVYADNYFHGSTWVLGRLSEESIGFEESPDSKLITMAEKAPNSIKNVLGLAEVLHRCYLELHEYDAARAVEVQMAAIRFMGNNDTMSETGDETSPLHLIDELHTLDTQCNMQEFWVSAPMRVVHHMDKVGLRNILRTYVEGLVGAGTRDVLRSLSSSDRASLREKCFEGYMHSLQWDENLLHSFIGRTQTGQRSIPIVPTELAGDRADDFGYNGFYESMAGAFDALLQDDTDSSSRRLARARHCLLQDIQKAVAPESLLTGMVGFTERLQVLNDLEDYAAGHLHPRDLAYMWGLGKDDAMLNIAEEDPDYLQKKGCTYGIGEFSLSTREIFLRILHAKSQFSEEFDPLPALVSQLWRFCRTSRIQGDPDLASSSLQRLRRTLKMPKDLTQDVSKSLVTRLQLRHEESKILEAKGDIPGAIRTGRLVVSHLNRMKTVLGGNLSEAASVLLAEALLNCGIWMNVYKVEPAQEVLRSYLKPAAKMARVCQEEHKTTIFAARSSKAFVHLAELGSTLFDSVSSRIESQEWKAAGSFIEVKRRELKICQDLLDEKKKAISKAARKKRKGPSASEKQTNGLFSKEHQDLHTHTNRLTKEVAQMTTERCKVEESVGGFLRLTMQSYGAALSVDKLDSVDMSRHMFRFVSLWFANCAGSESTLNENVSSMLERIPSFRFVPLTHQIFSHIGGEQSFQDALGRLVHRMCADHPYHCLVQLIALSNGNRVGSGVDGRHATDYLENVGESKVTAANRILLGLKNDGAPAYVGDLVESYTALVDAYIELAMAPTEELHKSGGKGVSFSSFSGGGRLDQCLGTGKRRFSCPPCVITKPPPIDPGGDYFKGEEDPIGTERVESFQPAFSLTETGLHRPKIVVCIGTKKSEFKQLVKGKEDIRQDAVMEQVFSCVNDLLKQRRSSRRTTRNDGARVDGMWENYSSTLQRRLKLPTYCIVPLSPTCGVLEWVNDTIPFGNYLLDKGNYVGAHSKYYPGEWGSELCAQHYRHAPSAAKREAFDVVCDHLSPAFRFFFVERFAHSLQEWHSAKMTYTRSCAVNSIVGHMLGIGDRHCQNILVNEKTGALCHIDFGIVFDGGKSLPIPETVPFRLTRDIVDGMGPCGTEGTFSRAAEATTAVLRENANTLLTILSAVVADPLYRWSITPVKALQRQRLVDESSQGGLPGENNETKSGQDSNHSSESHNDAATRAIARIHEKLQGYEDGTSGECQSVEGQVQLLINSARDPNNLCALYYGWAPWL